MVSAPVTVAVAFNTPGCTAGENVTCTLQLPPGDSDSVHVFVCPNWVDSPIDDIAIVAAEFAGFVTVSSTGGDVVPIDCPPKSYEPRLMVGGALPGVPLTGSELGPVP